MLNENNIMSCFLLNPNTGRYSPVRREGIIKLDYENERLKINTESEKIALDLGYTIDCDIKDIVFKIDNKTINIKKVEHKEAITKYNILENECVIISNDNNFKTIVWLNGNNIGKTFYYNLLTLNSTLSSYDINYIAKKINNLDVEYLNKSMEKISNNIESIINRLEILDIDLYQAEDKIATLKEELLSIKNNITGNNAMLNSDTKNEEEEVKNIEENKEASPTFD